MSAPDSFAATLDELVQAAKLLGRTEAKKERGDYTAQDARFEAMMHKSIATHRAALASQRANACCGNWAAGTSCFSDPKTNCPHLLSEAAPAGAQVPTEWREAVNAAREAMRAVRINMKNNAPHLSGKSWGYLDQALERLDALAAAPEAPAQAAQKENHGRTSQ